jgi:hypothetical protein
MLGAGIDAMRLFTAAADDSIGCQFLDGNYAVIDGLLLMIIVTASDLAFFATARANIKVNVKTFIHSI